MFLSSSSSPPPPFRLVLLPDGDVAQRPELRVEANLLRLRRAELIADAAHLVSELDDLVHLRVALLHEGVALLLELRDPRVLLRARAPRALVHLPAEVGILPLEIFDVLQRASLPLRRRPRLKTRACDL